MVRGKRCPILQRVKRVREFGESAKKSHVRVSQWYEVLIPIQPGLAAFYKTYVRCICVLLQPARALIIKPTLACICLGTNSRKCPLILVRSRSCTHAVFGDVKPTRSNAVHSSCIKSSYLPRSSLFTLKIPTYLHFQHITYVNVCDHFRNSVKTKWNIQQSNSKICYCTCNPKLLIFGHLILNPSN
jgi:hypothetical protein